MRIPPATAALGCAAAVRAASASIRVERPAPVRSATVRTVPGATAVTPGTAVPCAIAR